MAPRASKSLVLPGALAAIGAWSLLRFSPLSAFAAPSALQSSANAVGDGPALGFGLPRQATGARTGLAAGPGGVAVLEQEQASTYTGPSVGNLAMQAVGLLATAGAVMAATVGMKSAVQGVVGVAGLYVIMSLNEYCVHRYYQHLGINKTGFMRWLRNKFGFKAMRTSGHVEHHKETLDDMTLDMKPDPILDADPFRGTAFSWSVSAMMTFEIALQSYPWLWLCGWSFKASTIALFAALLLHACVWQTLHPSMHELPDPPLTYGVPGWSLKFLRKSGYFKFLYMNHEGHHRAPGAHGNYNVCCPLADHLFGTYVGVIPPQQPQPQVA